MEHTISSQMVADMAGKQHLHVMRDIRRIIKQLEEWDEIGESKSGLSSTSYFIPGIYRNAQNKRMPYFELTKVGCNLFGTRMSGSKGTIFAAQYIAKFEEMERQIGEYAQPDLLEYEAEDDDYEAQAAPALPSTITPAREQLQIMLRVTEENSQRIDDTQTRLTDLEQNAAIAPAAYRFIGERVSQRVMEVGKSFGENISNAQKRLLFKDINGSVKRVTGVAYRSELKKQHYQKVIELINIWEPSVSTRELVKELGRGQ